MTAAWTRISHRLLVSLTLGACAACSHSGDVEWLTVKSPPEARALDQLAVSGNACGPAALLNSMRFADARWQPAMSRFEGQSDRAVLAGVIRHHGMRASPHLGGRPRWSKRGINVVDLTDIANELLAPQRAGLLRHEVLAAVPACDSSRLLALAHQRIGRSLRRGVPPILSLRRFVYRDGAWDAVDAHFITITAVSRWLPRGADAFAIESIDPWGGVHDQGRIRMPQSDSAGFLIADLPESNRDGRHPRGRGASFVAASAVIGRF